MHGQGPAPCPKGTEPRGSGWGLGGPGSRSGALLPPRGPGCSGWEPPEEEDEEERSLCRVFTGSLRHSRSQPGFYGVRGFFLSCFVFFFFFFPLPEAFSPGGTGRSHPRRSVFQVAGGTRRRWSRIPLPGPAGSTGGLRGAPPSPSAPHPGTFCPQGRRGRRGEDGAGGRTDRAELPEPAAPAPSGDPGPGEREDGERVPGRRVMGTQPRVAGGQCRMGELPQMRKGSAVSLELREMVNNGHPLEFWEDNRNGNCQSSHRISAKWRVLVQDGD